MAPRGNTTFKKLVKRIDQAADRQHLHGHPEQDDALEMLLQGLQVTALTMTSLRIPSCFVYFVSRWER